MGREGRGRKGREGNGSMQSMHPLAFSKVVAYASHIDLSLVILLCGRPVLDVYCPSVRPSVPYGLLTRKQQENHAVARKARDVAAFFSV